MTADEILIEGVRRRDPGAWAEIYQRLSGQVYGFFLHQVRSRDVAEDLTAGVFLEALQAADRFEGKFYDLRAWLFRIGRNNLIDHRRRKERQVASIEETDPSELARALPMADPEEAALSSLEQQRVVEAIQTLSPDQKEVLVLRLTGDLTSAQIAQIVGKTPGAVKALQHRGLVALTKALAPYPSRSPERLLEEEDR